MGLKELEGKDIYVKLTSGRIYTGKVVEVAYLGLDTSNIQLYMISIIDKFGKNVSFSNKEISFVEEAR